jgi:hypothetical protein
MVLCALIHNSMEIGQSAFLLRARARLASEKKDKKKEKDSNDARRFILS